MLRRAELKVKAVAVEYRVRHMETEYDLSEVIALTHRKTKDIINRDGFAVTGFVMTKENGEKCVVDMSAVRWMSSGEFFKMMHPDA